MEKVRTGSAYTILFAAGLGLVCAGALTAAHVVLAPYHEANAAARNMRHIVLALRVSGAEDASPAAAMELFATKIREERRGEVTVWRYVEGESTRGFAVAFSGRGYTAPIEGFIGLEPDLRTIRGLAVSYQAETPGLGGQVGSRAFLDRFAGKQIDGLRLVRGRTAGAPTEVDAITGATITSGRFQVILDELSGRVRKLRAYPNNPDRLPSGDVMPSPDSSGRSILPANSEGFPRSAARFFAPTQVGAQNDINQSPVCGVIRIGSKDGT